MCCLDALSQIERLCISLLWLKHWFKSTIISHFPFSTETAIKIAFPVAHPVLWILPASSFCVGQDLADFWKKFFICFFFLNQLWTRMLARMQHWCFLLHFIHIHSGVTQDANRLLHLFWFLVLAFPHSFLIWIYGNHFFQMFFHDCSSLSLSSQIRYVQPSTAKSWSSPLTVKAPIHIY